MAPQWAVIRYLHISDSTPQPLALHLGHFQSLSFNRCKGFNPVVYSNHGGEEPTTPAAPMWCNTPHRVIN